MDYKKVTDEIVAKAGGAENVSNLSHCMTRLRFVLRDETKADLEGIKGIRGVLGATFGAGQLQVIMGQNLLNAFQTIMENYHFGEGRESLPKEKNRPENGKTIAADTLNFVAGSVSPVVTGLVAGGAAGGITAGIFGVKAYMMSKTTILAVPIFQETMWGMLAACMAAFAVACIVAYAAGIGEETERVATKKGEGHKTAAGEEVAETELLAVVDGHTFSLDEVNDEVFSKKIMGDGMGFAAEGSVVTAPCGGELTTVFPGGHAYGITRDDGVQVMVHIGIDTVSLNGKGFHVKVKQGDRIRTGEELVEMDLKYLRTTGLDLSVMMIVLDTAGKELHLEEHKETIKGKTVVAII